MISTRSKVKIGPASLIGVLFIFISATVFTQKLDSLVVYSDLSYQSIFEEMIFSKLEKEQEVSLLDLYLAIGVGSESEAGRCRDGLNALISRMKKAGVDEKKQKKQVKEIYEETHASLMVHYEEEAYFPDLFRTGDFNCVTGSVVYSLIFTEFGIPYSIQKGLNHVNLVAFPETLTMLVESTDSEEGIRTMDKGAKEAYVEQLSRGKLITPEQRMQGNIASIFMQYALSESQIDEYELASYQYFNKGIFEAIELQFEESHKALEKAFYLKPGLELAGMLLQTGAMVLHQSEYSKTEHVELVCKIARFSKFGITDDDVFAEFSRITQKILYERNDLQDYEEAFEILSSNLRSEKLVKKISLAYYSVVIEDMINEGNLAGALMYLDDLYAWGKDDKRILKSIQDILISHLSSVNISPPQQVAFMDRYRSQLPEVYELQMMKLLDLSSYLSAAEYYFSSGDAAQATLYLDLFEAGAGEVDNLSMVAQEIESAYEMAAFYYYDRGNMPRTRGVLDRGLKIFPQSHRLKYLRGSV